VSPPSLSLSSLLLNHTESYWIILNCWFCFPPLWTIYRISLRRFFLCICRALPCWYHCRRTLSSLYCSSSLWRWNFYFLVAQRN
jgi:hypothetical protein